MIKADLFAEKKEKAYISPKDKHIKDTLVKYLRREHITLSLALKLAAIAYAKSVMDENHTQKK